MLCAPSYVGIFCISSVTFCPIVVFSILSPLSFPNSGVQFSVTSVSISMAGSL